MILHELVTNAAKYGALSAPGGQIDLTWSLQEASEPRLKLRWQESGGPLVKPPLRKGFGATLLEGLLPEANARISYHPEGIVYELEVPASAVVVVSSAPSDGLPREVMRAESIADKTEPRAAAS